MKITGLELINKIYNNEIKEGTHINYYKDDYLDYEFYGKLLFTNGAIWFTDNRPECDMEVKTSIILDNHNKFEILEEEKKETKPLTKKDIEALGYACGEIQKCFTNGWKKSLENKPLEEQNKIPDKIIIAKDNDNDEYIMGKCCEKITYSISDIFIANKINEIIDYLKSKGDE